MGHFTLGCLFVVYFYMCIILHSVMTCFRLFVCCLLLHVVVYNCNSAVIYFRLFVCYLLLYVVYNCTRCDDLF